ncbi:MAG: PIN domain-containing protein [Akkermansiaceae bacterium]|jgi:predicted nucleic acid-binding protein|nr:PIN domain-containing protein [Akkermansiaceae bacterium]
MNHRYGIDTSVLVRLLTGDPAADYQKTVAAFEKRLEAEPQAELFASNQVIGEAYIALQHHYGIAKHQARAALLSVLTSGLCSPQNGAAVLTALQTNQGCGLLDRLIVDDYSARGMTVVTHDRRMNKLPGVEKL